MAGSWQCPGILSQLPTDSPPDAAGNPGHDQATGSGEPVAQCQQMDFTSEEDQPVKPKPRRKKAKTKAKKRGRSSPVKTLSSAESDHDESDAEVERRRQKQREPLKRSRGDSAPPLPAEHFDQPQKYKMVHARKLRPQGPLKGIEGVATLDDIDAARAAKDGSMMRYNYFKLSRGLGS